LLHCRMRVKELVHGHCARVWFSVLWVPALPQEEATGEEHRARKRETSDLRGDGKEKRRALSNEEKNGKKIALVQRKCERKPHGTLGIKGIAPSAFEGKNLLRGRLSLKVLK